MYRRPGQTFGPQIFHADGGEMVARCYGSGMICAFDIGGTCTYVKPSRQIGGQLTPDWCPLKANMIEDAKELEDFERMGLADMNRRELLAEVKRIPDEFRPKPLTEANAPMLRGAIRKARLAAGEGA